MRWKLLVMTSVVASLVGGALWSAMVAALFGPAALVARHDWLLPLSFVIPLGIAVLAGYFVYRHTARRRKTQAVITVIVTLFLTALIHVAIAHSWPNYFILRPRVAHEVVLLN
jgi:branched-subunit amino acid ABC-type transport system permease component